MFVVSCFCWLLNMVPCASFVGCSLLFVVVESLFYFVCGLLLGV